MSDEGGLVTLILDENDVKSDVLDQDKDDLKEEEKD